MKIMFVSSEVAPFIKTGGLGDVAGALPEALAAAGHDVRVFCPLYSAIGQNWREKMTHLKNAYVQLGWRNQYCGIFYCEKGGVTYYFIDNEYYFARSCMVSMMMQKDSHTLVRQCSRSCPTWIGNPMSSTATIGRPHLCRYIIT